jgi:hypothetical protein
MDAAEKRTIAAQRRKQQQKEQEAYINGILKKHDKSQSGACSRGRVQRAAVCRITPCCALPPGCRPDLAAR